MRASTLAAGLVVSCVFIPPSLLNAAEFAGPTASVELPALRPEEMVKSVVVAKGVGTDAAALTLNLLNPDAPLKGTLDKYELTADPATKSWKVDAVAKSKQHKTVGKLILEGDSLTFKWEAGVTKIDGGGLRNCVLTIAGSADQAVALRMPTVQKAIPLDLTKDVTRIPLADDLPDETFLTLAVAGVQGPDVAATIPVPEGRVKESILVGLKAADENAPGVQVRIALWKLPTTKPEIVIRSELTPMAQPAIPAFGNQAAPPPAIGAAPVPSPTAAAPAVVDPTRLSPDIPLFTSRSLTAAKGAISRQMQQAKAQLMQSQNMLVAKQNQLAQFDGDAEDEAEAQAVSQLQSDVATLSQQKTTLENTMIPNFEKQLAAIEPLEKLRQSLHLRTMISLRVSYLVAGKPVNAFVAADEPAK